MTVKAAVLQSVGKHFGYSLRRVSDKRYNPRHFGSSDPSRVQREAIPFICSICNNWGHRLPLCPLAQPVHHPEMQGWCFQVLYSLKKMDTGISEEDESGPESLSDHTSRAPKSIWELDLPISDEATGRPGITERNWSPSEQCFLPQRSRDTTHHSRSVSQGDPSNPVPMMSCSPHNHLKTSSEAQSSTCMPKMHALYIPKERE